MSPDKMLLAVLLVGKRGESREYYLFVCVYHILKLDTVTNGLAKIQ